LNLRPACAAFARKYRTEMAASDASKALDLLAAHSPRVDLSVGCYREDEGRRTRTPSVRSGNASSREVGQGETHSQG
jgi:aspartate/tyrosine/aromatic aminotransferase